MNKSSICVIIRNNQVLVIAALAQQLSQAYQAMEIEAMDVVRALEFGLEVGVDRVLMEGDCEIVVKALVEDNPSLASHEQLTKHVGLFSNYFSKLLYSHTKREDNKIAHNLAKLAINYPNCAVWMEDIPQLIYHVLQEYGYFGLNKLNVFSLQKNFFEFLRVIQNLLYDTILCKNVALNMNTGHYMTHEITHIKQRHMRFKY